MSDNDEDSINNKKSPYTDSLNNSSAQTGERLLSKFERESTTQSKLEKRTSARIEQGAEGLQKLPAARQAPELDRLIKLGQSQEQNAQVRLYGAGINLRSETQTAFSGRAIDRMIAHETRAADPSATVGLASRNSIFDLEAQHKQHLSSVHQMSRSVVDLTAKPYEDEFATSYAEGTSQIGRSAIAAGQTASAMHYAKTMGQDRLSLAKSATVDRDRYDAILGRKDTQEGLAAGKFGDRDKIEKTYIDAMTKAREAADKLAKALEAGNTTQEESNQLLAERNITAKEAEKASDVRKQSDAGGGGRGGISPTMQIASAVGIGLQAAGAAYREIAVNTPLQKLQQRAGFADIANTRFNDVFAATQGDMAAQRRAQHYAYNVGSMQSTFDAAQIAAGMEAGGAAVNLGVTGVKAYQNTLSAKGLLSSGATVAEGIQQAAPDAANALITANKFKEGIQAREGALAKFQAMRQLDDSRNQISDFINQTVMDQNRGLTMASRGLGGSTRTTLQDTLMQPSTVTELANLGVNLQDTSRLVGAGQHALGGGLRAGDIKRGAELAQRGTLSSGDEYLQMRGALSNVGGNAKDMESLLKNAVANGMDNSKNIKQMVDSTATLAQSSAAAGVSGVVGANVMMGGALGAMANTGLGIDAKNAAALSGAQMANQLTSGRDTTIATMLFNSKMRSQFANLSPLAQSTLQATNIQQANELANTKDTDIEQALTARGLRSSLWAQGDMAKTRANIKAFQAAKREEGINQFIGFGVSELSPELRTEAAKGTAFTKLSKPLQDVVNQYGVNKGVSGSAVWGATVLGDDTGPGSKKDVGSGGRAAQGEQTIAAGANAYAKVFTDGAARFDKVFKDNLQMVKNLSPAQMAAASQKAASDFSLPESVVGTFSTSVTTFSTACDNLKTYMDEITKKIGIKMPDTHANPPGFIPKTLLPGNSGKNPVMDQVAGYMGLNKTN